MPDGRTADDALPRPASVEATTTRGYVGIGVHRSTFGVNVGTLVRSAHATGGTFVFTVGRRYVGQPRAVGQDRHLPLLHFETVESLAASMPDDATRVCVEVAPSSRPLHSFVHPERARYLPGAQDGSLPDEVVTAHPPVEVASEWPRNVATAGSVVRYGRLVKRLDRAHHGPTVPTWWTGEWHSVPGMWRFRSLGRLGIPRSDGYRLTDGTRAHHVSPLRRNPNR